MLQKATQYRRKGLSSLILSLLDHCRYALAPSTSAPSFLYIEPTNICNARCVFCPYPLDRRSKGFIEESLFKGALNEYRAMGGRRIGLTPLFGEILVDPQIIHKIRYVHRLGFESVHAYTNATLLHQHDVRELLCAGLTSLHVSTAPLDCSTYQRIFRLRNYDRILENLKQLLRTFHDTPEKTLRSLTIEFRADRSFSECLQTPDFRRYIAPLIGNGISLAGFSAFDAWGGIIREKQLLPGMSLRRAPLVKILPCNRSSVLHVCVNGDVRVCGCRYDLTSEKDELLLGNINQMSLKDLYHHRRVRRLKRPTFSLHFEICRKCSWYSLNVTRVL